MGLGFQQSRSSLHWWNESCEIFLAQTPPPLPLHPVLNLLGFRVFERTHDHPKWPCETTKQDTPTHMRTHTHTQTDTFMQSQASFELGAWAQHCATSGCHSDNQDKPRAGSLGAALCHIGLPQGQPCELQAVSLGAALCNIGLPHGQQ